MHETNNHGCVFPSGGRHAGGEPTEKTRNRQNEQFLGPRRTEGEMDVNDANDY